MNPIRGISDPHRMIPKDHSFCYPNMKMNGRIGAIGPMPRMMWMHLSFHHSDRIGHRPDRNLNRILRRLDVLETRSVQDHFFFF
jgi:hypothetical protein